MARRKRPATALARIKRTAKRNPLLVGGGVLATLLLLWRLRQPAAPRLLTNQERISQAANAGNYNFVYNPGAAAQIAGSDTTAQALSLTDPPQALAELDALDRRWSPAVEGYRAIHDFRGGLIGAPFGASQWMGGARYPTRWAVLRLTVDALLKGNDQLAKAYGPQYAFTDATTGKPSPAWVALLTTYSPTSTDIQGMSAEVERVYSGASSPGVFSAILGGLKTLVGSTALAVSLQWGALGKSLGDLHNRAINGLGSDADFTARALSRDEQAILARLQTIQVVVLVDTPTVDAPRTLTAQEVLSGGGVPVGVGLAALGGVPAFAAELRLLPISPDAKALSDDALCLKAALLARREPLTNKNPSSLPQRTAEDL